jgi:hypothetical protein
MEGARCEWRKDEPLAAAVPPAHLGATPPLVRGNSHADAQAVPRGHPRGPALLGTGAREAPNRPAKPEDDTGGNAPGARAPHRAEARLAMWHPDSDSLTGIAVETFAERGKRPQVPGPRPGAPRYRDPGISAQLTRARHPHLPFSRGASRSRQTNLSGPTMDGRWRACI